MKRVALVLFALAACQSAEVEVPAVPALPSTYDTLIAPILAERCTGCHGAERAKGGLRLHTPEAIRAGGTSGAVFVAGDAETSELVRRLKLPLADEEHMPPDDKPQLDPLEQALLAGWIRAGAPFEGRVEALHESQSLQVKPAAPAPIVPADAAALAHLRDALVHVQPMARGSNGLWIDFAAIAPKVDDALVLKLVEPVKGQVVELALARTRVGAATLELCARLEHLERLDLRDTKLDDAGLAKLGTHANLRELVLARTSITAASVPLLLSLPKLDHVFLWGCALPPEELARLRARAGLVVDAGDKPDAVLAELEPPPKFTSELPSPDAPPPGDPDAPINTLCPITGSPVNAKYTRKFEGRVIGFCCPNCPAEFDKDPAACAAKVISALESKPKTP
jgi:YHS domain-containing protein